MAKVKKKDAVKTMESAQKAMQAEAKKRHAALLKKAKTTRLPFLAQTSPRVKAGVFGSLLMSVMALSAVAALVVIAVKRDPEIAALVEKEDDEGKS